MANVMSFLVSRTGQVYAVDGIHYHSNIARELNIDEDKMLRYEFSILHGTLSLYGSNDVPFDVKQSHENAAIWFIKNTIGAPEKLISYVKRSQGNWDGTLKYLLNSNALRKFENEIYPNFFGQEARELWIKLYSNPKNRDRNKDIEYITNHITARIMSENKKKFPLLENLTLDLDIGDIILTGKFKNKRTVVKSIGKDSELNQPTVNGKPILNFRIEKLLPDAKKSKETREEKKSSPSLKEVFKEMASNNSNGNWYRPWEKELEALKNNPVAIKNSFIVYYGPDDTKEDKNWRPKFPDILNDIWLFLPQTSPLIKLFHKQAKADTKNYFFNEKMKKLFNEYVVINGKQIKKIDFWLKPSGIDPYTFVKNKVNEWATAIDNEKNTYKQQFARLNNVLYHSTGKLDIRVGQAIKPYWSKEDMELRSSLSLGFEGKNAEFIEKILEKGRPKNLPSRINSVYTFENFDDVYNWKTDEKRIIVAVKPIGKTYRVDMNIPTQLYGLYQNHADRIEYSYNKPTEKEIEILKKNLKQKFKN